MAFKMQCVNSAKPQNARNKQIRGQTGELSLTKQTKKSNRGRKDLKVKQRELELKKRMKERRKEFDISVTVHHIYK